MSLSNNVPLRVYPHTTSWPGWIDSQTHVGAGHNPATFFPQINRTTYRHIQKLAILQATASSTSPGSDFLCSCKTDEQGHSDIYGYMC